ncbi:MAG: DNA-processing protein DprA [Verrucomicrobiota bacterium]
MTSEECFLILNGLPKIGPVQVKRLISSFGSVEALFSCSESKLEAVEGVTRAAANSISNWARYFDLDEELKKIEKYQVVIIHWEHSDYPQMLKEIYDPPLVLYCRGDVSILAKKGIGIVGSRKTTYYGLETAKKLSYQIAYSGMTVISGLARGIDTAAHQGALAAKGKTVAVLGSSLDHLYPTENRSLAKMMVEQEGAVITEFPFGTPPDRQTFPMRNRIVSGMSSGVLVVEAGDKSGALITSRMALEQGRPVFAVPGRITSPESKGCHLLIKEGAQLVESVEDILSEFEFFSPKIEENEKRSWPDDLSPEEKKILELMEVDEMQIDTIIRKCGLPSPVVSSTLLRLEMRKLVRQLPGKLFIKTD